MIDKFDSERFAAAYRILAEILDRDRPADQESNHLSFVIGELTRRVFVGTRFDPPDEVLEQVGQVLRSGNVGQWHQMAQKLLEHADHFDELSADDPPQQ